MINKGVFIICYIFATDLVVYTCKKIGILNKKAKLAHDKQIHDITDIFDKYYH